LFLRSLRRIQNVDPGFDAEHVLTASLNINLLRYTTAQGSEFYHQVLERVEALPGVQRASLARVVPISGGGRATTFTIEGQPEAPDASRNPDAQPVVATNVIGLNYFDAMGIALAQGRDFTAQDVEGAPGVVIINEAFAHRHFDGEIS